MKNSIEYKVFSIGYGNWIITLHAYHFCLSLRGRPKQSYINIYKDINVRLPRQPMTIGFLAMTNSEPDACLVLRGSLYSFVHDPVRSRDRFMMKRMPNAMREQNYKNKTICRSGMIAICF